MKNYEIGNSQPEEDGFLNLESDEQYFLRFQFLVRNPQIAQEAVKLIQGGANFETVNAFVEARQNKLKTEK